MTEKENRQQYNLKNELIPVLPYMEDPAVTDIMVNPDQSLWVKCQGRAAVRRGSLDAKVTERILAFTASMLNRTINSDNPDIDGIIPLREYSARISGVIPPWSVAPSFCIRKPSESIYTLSDYLGSGRATPKQAEVIRGAVRDKRNIVIAGGTGSGKTTMLNALIDLIREVHPSDRLYLVEDTAEIQCPAENFVSLVVPPEHSARAVRKSLRFFPDRIIFGEIRYGETALELLKAWNTGHPGGLTTLHANSADHVKPRFQNLLQEVMTSGGAAELIGSAVSLVIYMERGARITDIKIFKEEE